MTDVTEKKINKFHRQFTVAFSAICLKNFLVPLYFHVLLSPNLVKNLTNLVLSQHTLVRRYGSRWRKNLKRLERTGTERFGKIFLNT